MLISKNDCISISNINFYKTYDGDNVMVPHKVSIRMKNDDAIRFISVIKEYKIKNLSSLYKIDFWYDNITDRFRYYEEDGYVVFPIVVPMAVTFNGVKKCPMKILEEIKAFNGVIKQITCGIVCEENATASNFFLVLEAVRGRTVTTAGIPINSPFFKWNKEITLDDVPVAVIEGLKNNTINSIDDLLAKSLENGTLLSEADALKVFEILKEEGIPTV